MGHYYTHNGRYLPSPTTILGDSIDKSGAMTQAAANLTANWIKNNNPQTDEDFDKARFFYKKEWKQATIYGSIAHRVIRMLLSSGYLYRSKPAACNP